MADFPNVIDLMFGRIDRNTDTQYRDKALQQNQNQFTSQLDADKERTRIAHEQFMKNFELQTDQFNQQKNQQGFTNKLTVNEAVAKGLFRPVATQQQQGVMPGNMFMRNPGAIPGVDNGDPTMGPGFEAEGMRLQPVNQFKQLLDQRAATHTQDSKFTNQAKADKINALIKVGVPPAIAVFQTEDPVTAAHMFSSPQNMIAALKMIGSTNPGADAVAKTVAEYMAGYQGAVAEAGETASEKSYRAGMTNQANAHAEMYRSQQANDADAQAGYIVMNKYAAEISKLMPTTDGRYVGLIRQKLDADPSLTPGQRAAAIRQLNNESTIRTGLPNFFDQFNLNKDAGKNPQTPSYPIVPQSTPTVTSPGDTSRPSGAMPAVVNDKPPTTTAPVGALRYTQPDQAPMPELVNGMVPVKRSDGSVDGYVTPEKWQEMNKPATGFSGMGLSNPLTGFSKMMLEYQQRNAAKRKQEYNPNSQGFGYRPPGY